MLVVSSYILEIISAFKELLDEKGLADSSSTADYRKFRFYGIKAFLEFATFTVTCYEFSFIIFCKDSS